MGFIEETGIARYYRDARITPIYEGTNGVQAMDLVGRKLQMEEGRLPFELLDELEEDAGRDVRDAITTLREVTRTLQAAGNEDRAAAAKAYLDMFGAVIGAALLERGARQAASDSRGAQWPVLSRFFNATCLAPALALTGAISGGASLLSPAAEPG